MSMTMEALEAKLLEMENEIRVLKDTEAIKCLKGKYMRLLDSKAWDEIGECFAPDVVTSYSDGKYVFEGAENVVKFLSSVMLPVHITMHLAHTPEVEVLSENTAKATWYLNDFEILQNKKEALKGGAFYHEEYVKLDGQWKIKRIGYQRTFEERMPWPGPQGYSLAESMHEIMEM